MRLDEPRLESQFDLPGRHILHHLNGKVTIKLEKPGHENGENDQEKINWNGKGISLLQTRFNELLEEHQDGDHNARKYETLHIGALYVLEHYDP